MTRAVCSEVEGDMLLGEVHRLARAVERVHTLCPRGKCIDGEAPRVAEGIEHPTSISILCQKGSIVPLVDEEACLLPLEPVGDELQSVLPHIAGLGMSDEEAILCELPHISCREGRLRLVVDGS